MGSLRAIAVGVDRANPDVGVLASHAGHDQVEHDGGQPRVVPAEELDSLHTVDGRDDLVPDPTKHHLGRVTNERLVLDEQDGPTSGAYHSERLRSRRTRSAWRRREVDPHDGAVWGVARDLDGAAVALHDAIDRREPEPGPLPLAVRLGREVGLEHAPPDG